MSNLDDFFAKKDKKKSGKKNDAVVKTSDLFKVLDNAAENVNWDEQESMVVKRKEPQIGPVLSEVLNADEASKWSEPMEEERQFDLSNLKIQTLLTTENGEETDGQQSKETIKPTKMWQIPQTKEQTSSKQETKTEELLEKDQVLVETAVVAASHKEKAVDNDNSISKSVDRKQQEENASEQIKAPGTSDNGTSDNTSTKESVAEPAAKPAYIPPALRGKVSTSDGPSVSTSEPLKPSAPAAVAVGAGAYVPPAVRAQMAAQKDSASGSTNLQPTKLFGGGSAVAIEKPKQKPVLDSVEEFPTLGGPPNKRK